MEAKYSVLLCNQSLAEYESKIEQWLASGIKVFWFGTEEDAATLTAKHKAYADAFLLLAYSVLLQESAVIIDGVDPEGFVEAHLVHGCMTFNSAQYLVEHADNQEHIIVQASAGTGKTTVMIDRILYLLHTQPSLKLSEVYMITFTNEAADQMSRRLQDVLMRRYELTGQTKYLRWVEEQSQMHISTIHSFALYMLREYGIGESFTKELTIRSFQYERRELIKDTIDNKTNDENTVVSQLGVPFYRANSIVGDFWNGFSKLGISHRDLSKMDWGKPIDTGSEPFHRVMTGIVEQLDQDYFDIKRRNEAIGVDDIMRDLQEVLTNSDLPTPDISMKYLFIDEFQDSDLSQIKVACMMIQLLGATLFVVGDVKQSIYRFRGATDQSFFVLRRDMEEMGIKAAKDYTLINNYRTAAGVLERLNDYFREWRSMGMLQYDRSVIPFNHRAGYIRMLHGEKKEHAEEQIADVISEQLNRLVAEVQESGRTPSEKDRVVVLTRTNNELKQLAGILRRYKIPASVQQEGVFFSSEAVRDFYAMVCSFLFSDEPKYIFGYLLTPYAGETDPIDINAMEHLNGDYQNDVDYLDHFLNQTSWKKYYKELRLRPVMSVFKEILDGESVIDHFIANSKARKRAAGWSEERCNAATMTEARQYQANLEKLMELLQVNLGGDKVSIYDVYNYLRLAIATNRQEGNAPVQTTDDYTSVLCMTVHKAKGLEFQTVIIPYTNRSFPRWESTEILIDPVERKVGWNYTGDSEKKKRRRAYPGMRNSLYSSLKEKELDDAAKEESRILYVAMTRAINTLICIVPNPKNEHTWAHMIQEVGIDYE